jgi:hypothetical protein
MGMKKISTLNEREIVGAIRKWSTANRLTWEILRKFLADSQQKTLSAIWSRQSLSANKSIKDAFSAFKARQKQLSIQSVPKSEDAQSARIAKLEAELHDLRSKHDRLLLRHAQLTYNASLLEGGTQLLDPLPDNTRSQLG